MIVCVCKAVRDHQIRRAIREGADSVREIGRATRAGTECGSCAVDLRAMLSEERACTPLVAAAK